MAYRDNVVLDVDERPAPWQWFSLSLQHMSPMFGSTALVPILVGLNPGIALFSSGVGTLMYLLIIKHKVPAYMGSSFSFVVPMMVLMKTTGYPGIVQGTIAVGCVYLVVSVIVTLVGSQWIDRILPPVVVDLIAVVIGLSLAGTAAKDATINSATGHYDLRFFAIVMLTMTITVIFNMYFKGFLGLIPILMRVIAGYIITVLFNIVGFSPAAHAHWFSLPDFQIPFVDHHPQLYWGAVLSMASITFVTMIEHLGHIMVLNELTGRNYFNEPGLNYTPAGDGTASIIAGFVGGPPVTNYGENIGVMAITRIHSVYIIAGTTVFAILFSFIGKLNALIESIPSPAIGGISFLLFGVIASSGLRVMIGSKIDFSEKRNLVISSAISVVGIGNAYLQLGKYQLFGLAVAAVLRIIMNLILPQKAKSEM